MKKRDTFSSNIGFVIAAAASAVGLGNIWRFPYLAAKYGGGIFLIIYLLFVVTFGFSLMIAENALGRKTGKSELEAFSAIDKRFKFLGVLSLIVPCIILPYYNVIGGWIIRFLVGYIGGATTQMAEDSYFTNMLMSPSTMILFHFIFTLLTALILILGVKKGIENISKILMPILFVLAIIISVYSISLPGAMEGVKYFFIPNFKDLTIGTLIKAMVAAMGQMFYSMSLAMGIMIAYGSYLPKEANLEKSVKQIEIFDTVIAILAGLMIIPAVFAFSGGDKSALSAGPTLMFITLPKVFYSMSFSTGIGILFFLLVLFAALTSSVSIMEAIVSSICDKFECGRKKTILACAILAFLVGILPILGYNLLSDVRILGFDILDFMDFIPNSILMPIVAFLTCIFIGWVAGVKIIDDEVELSGDFKRKKLFHIMIKYVAPILTAIILVSSILSALGIITI